MNKLISARILEKIAGDKDDVLHTATIGGIGLGTGFASAALSKKVPALGKTIFRAGATSGALALGGDYAAVKLNKKLSLDKKASVNKYLEKAAEMYSVKGHPGVHRNILNTPNVQLDRDQYHQYARDLWDSPKPLKHMAVGAALAGGLGAGIAHHRGGRPVAAGVLTGALGAYLGRKHGTERARMEALENLGIMHPHLLDAKNE